MENIKRVTIMKEDLKAVLDSDKGNRAYIMAFISDFGYYAEREWNASEIDNEMLLGYFETFEVSE